MSVNNLILLIALCLLASNAKSKVRELAVGKNEMESIYLKMGKSTVLRFNEKPRKVVIGNQNYFNVEFIDNDVTIQPLGKTTTNVFVYGEYQTYGLLLSVIEHDYYDDLVVIKRSFENVTKGSPIKKTSKSKQKINFKGKVGGSLSVTSENLFYHDLLKTYVLDLKIKNISQVGINSKEVKINLSRAKHLLEGQKIVFEKDMIEKDEEVRARILFQSNLQSLSLDVMFKDARWSQVIDGKYL